MFHIKDNRPEKKIFLSLENFQLAWIRIRNSVRLEVKDRLALNIYAADTDRHLKLLIRDIKTKKYKPQISDRIYVPKGDGTLRPFNYLSMRDRLVYQAIGNIIVKNSYGALLKNADKNLFAHLPERPDKKGHFTPYMVRQPFVKSSDEKSNFREGQYEKFQNSLLTTVREYSQYDDAWVIESDIASFYPSVDHNTLIEILKKYGWLSDKLILNILQDGLLSWSQFNHQYNVSQGIPIGYETSDILSTLFLLDIDEALLERKYKFLRYVDDIYIFAHSRSEALECLIFFDLLLQQHALIRGSAKTQLRQCNEILVDEEKFKHNLKKKLSMLEVQLKGQSEDRKVAQEDLLKEFYAIKSQLK